MGRISLLTELFIFRTSDKMIFERNSNTKPDKLLDQGKKKKIKRSQFFKLKSFSLVSKMCVYNPRVDIWTKQKVEMKATFCGVGFSNQMNNTMQYIMNHKL